MLSVVTGGHTMTTDLYQSLSEKFGPRGRVSLKEIGEAGGDSKDPEDHAEDLIMNGHLWKDTTGAYRLCPPRKRA